MKAANNSGVWNEEGAQLEFSILPAIYQAAEAKRIDIEIHCDPQQLRLMVRDDGKGLGPQVLRSGEKQGHD